VFAVNIPIKQKFNKSCGMTMGDHMEARGILIHIFLHSCELHDTNC